MARHEWGRGRGRGGPFRPRDYGVDFGSWGGEWGSSPSAGMRDRGVGIYRDWGTPFEAGGYGPRYDRELYGGEYPGYGGYPGSRRPGIHYGGYDAPYAGGPFIPEDAYRRHPQMDERPTRHVSGRWPEDEPGAEMAWQLGDHDIGRSVRDNLYADHWIDPDRIQIEVEDGVVTLKGEVDDYMEARYAWDDAWESVGVRGVLNHLTVRNERADEQGDPMVQTEGRG